MSFTHSAFDFFTYLTLSLQIFNETFLFDN